MSQDIAIAANRFGLGMKPGSLPSADPRKALLREMERFEPRFAALAALPSRANLAAALRDVRMARIDERNAAAEPKTLDAKTERNAYRRAIRDDHADAVDVRLQIAAQSETGFAERLVHFWSNHFAVSIDKIAVVSFAGNYEFEAIRPNIFGKFSDLLTATVYHPAMLLYLDQAQSIGPDSAVAQRVNARRDAGLGLNENLAREILELHTLGDRAAYTQSDVTEFARALTGITVAGLGRGAAQRLIQGSAGDTVFVDAIHQPGNRTLLGRSYPDKGKAQALAILSDLATHPATARHISTKLARHFVSDVPPPALVARLESNYLKTGGDLSSLYRVLIDAKESWQPQQGKFKSPWEWVVSSMRALNITSLPGKAVSLFTLMGQPIWKPGAPKGFGDMVSDWAGPAALMRRVEIAGRLAGRAAGRIDARALAETILPGIVSKTTAEHIARAKSPEQGLSLLLVAPEFLRR
jgi:uncharacterized protein (DUF1800 family)